MNSFRSIIDPPTPYELGSSAFHNRKSRWSNPFEPLTDEAIAWDNAFCHKQTCDQEGLPADPSEQDLADDCDEFCGFIGPAFQGSQEQVYFSGPGNGLERTCGGTGVLSCYCGGDLCVCGWHGEAECFGCSECEDSDDWDPYDEFYQDEEGYF